MNRRAAPGTVSPDAARFFSGSRRYGENVSSEGARSGLPRPKALVRLVHTRGRLWWESPRLWSYANALGNGLVYDDQFLIVRSWLVERLDFGSVFTTHYWAGYPGKPNRSLPAPDRVDVFCWTRWAAFGRFDIT